MGTRDEKLFVDPADREDLPEVFDDFDLNYCDIRAMAPFETEQKS